MNYNKENLKDMKYEELIKLKEQIIKEIEKRGQKTQKRIWKDKGNDEMIYTNKEI